MSAMGATRHAALLLAALLAPLAWTAACSSGDDSPPAVADDAAAAPPAIPRPNTNDPKVLRGWESVLKRDCAKCHQSPNAGDSILTGTTAYPANLTPDPDTGLDGWSSDSIVRAIRQGVDADGFKLCPTMPHFADMKDDEGAAIAAYLLFLPATHHSIPDSLCPPIKGPHVDDAGDDGPSGDASDGAADADAGASDAPDDAGDAADG